MRGCWCHDWGRWEVYDAPIVLFKRDSEREPIQATKPHQRRTCVRCGFTQIRVVGEL